MKKIFQLAIMACTALSVHATDYTRGLSIWFDTPNTLVNKAVWFGNTPDMWKGENKPESAGDTATNPDAGLLFLLSSVPFPTRTAAAFADAEEAASRRSP